MITLTIHRDTDTPAIMNVRDKNGERVPLADVTRYVATLTGKYATNNIVIDTNVYPGSITSTEQGDITFDFSEIDINKDDYEMLLVEYDARHPDGQKISGGGCGPYAHLRVC